MPKVKIDGQWVDVVDHKLNSHTAPDGDIDVNSKKLINVAAPVNTTDAANKTYVDGRRLDQIAVPLANVSMNNNRLTLVPNPVSTGDAVNKSYVDSAYVVTGRTWTGIVLANGWVHHTSGHPPGYMKDPSGMVHVRGLIKSGTSSVIGTIGNTTCRPSITVRFAIASANPAGGSGEVCQLDVGADGVMRLFGTYSATYLALDGVHFIAE